MSKAFIFEDFIDHVLTSMGVTSAARKKMWAGSTPSGHSTVDAKISTVHLARDFYKQQLLPGDRLEVLSNKFIHFIDQSVRGDGLLTREMSLMKWCGEVLVHTATESMFGERLLQIEPGLISTFLDFNSDAWMLIYKYPRIAARKMYKARDKIIDALVVYNRLLSEGEVPGESWLVRSLRTEQDRLGITDLDSARNTMIVFWA